MKDLYFAMPIEMFNSKSDENDKINLKRYGNMISKLREKYKDKYKIIDDLSLVKIDNPMDAITYSMVCVMGASSLDGLVLPLNYKEYEDLVALEDIVKEDNKKLFFFDEVSEQILTIEELTLLKNTEKMEVSATTMRASTSTKYSISNGDADIEYEEVDEKKYLTVYHMGSITKYEIK